MGAIELKFNGFFEKSNYLKDFQCSQCQQTITEQDIAERNYQLWVSDYANEITKDFYGDSQTHGISFWLKAVEHENCPDEKIVN